MIGILMGYLFGLLHGMRHALEPDHVAALSTLLTEQPSPRSSVRFALAWGAGHAVTLLVVGGMLYAFRKQMPPRVGDAFELGVALMLVALGVRAIVLAARSGGPIQEHVHVHAWAHAKRPLLIGFIHGLAGSGALAAMVMAELPTALAGFVFMGLYGFGAMCGMAMLAGLAGVSLARVARLPRVVPVLTAATGLFSIALGGAWGFPLAGRLLGS